jgi:hypothetical protein
LLLLLLLLLAAEATCKAWARPHGLLLLLEEAVGVHAHAKGCKRVCPRCGCCEHGVVLTLVASKG